MVVFEIMQRTRVLTHPLNAMRYQRRPTHRESIAIDRLQCIRVLQEYLASGQYAKHHVAKLLKEPKTFVLPPPGLSAHLRSHLIHPQHS